MRTRKLKQQPKVGQRVLWPACGHTQYWTIEEISESGRFARIERAHVTQYVAVGVLREKSV